MTAPSQNHPQRNSQRQRGAAMIIMMLIVMLGLIALFTLRMDRKGPELDADRKTALALAQAKEALIGYAAQDANRPGSFPCPDINDDGLSKPLVDYPCSQVVARLPWQELGLPDLRDGAGERLWYAISPKFASNNSSALNSTTLGQITIRDSNGTVIYDASASPSTGVIAVIIAPGQVITRQGAAAPQDRSCSGGNGCDSNLVCKSPYQSVSKCAPQNYLDILVGSEDNSDFVSPPPASPQNGFILGTIRDASGRTIVNDRILLITANDLFSVVKKRIFGEIKGTNTTGLLGYYHDHSTFPWAATSPTGGATPTTGGGLQAANTLVGYAPIADMSFPTRCDSAASCVDQGKMIDDKGWNTSNFYEVAPAFAPGGTQTCTLSATCLTVNGIPNAKVRIRIDGTDFGIW